MAVMRRLTKATAPNMARRHWPLSRASLVKATVHKLSWTRDPNACKVPGTS
jgi:hypothetical protein